MKSKESLSPDWADLNILNDVLRVAKAGRGASLTSPIISTTWLSLCTLWQYHITPVLKKFMAHMMLG